MGLTVEQVKAKQLSEKESKRSGTDKTKKNTDPETKKATDARELLEAYDQRYTDFLHKYIEEPRADKDYSKMDTAGDQKKLNDMLTFFNNADIEAELKSEAYKHLYPTRKYYTKFFGENKKTTNFYISIISGHLDAMNHYNQQRALEGGPNYWKYNSDLELTNYKKYTSDEYLDKTLKDKMTSHYDITKHRNFLMSAITFYSDHRHPHNLNAVENKRWLYIHYHFSDISDAVNKMEDELEIRGDIPATDYKDGHVRAFINSIRDETKILRGLEGRYLNDTISDQVTVKQLNADKLQLELLKKYLDSPDYMNKHSDFDINSKIISMNHMGDDIGTYAQFNYFKTHYSRIILKINKNIIEKQSRSTGVITSFKPVSKDNPKGTGLGKPTTIGADTSSDPTDTPTITSETEYETFRNDLLTMISADINDFETRRVNISRLRVRGAPIYEDYEDKIKEIEELKADMEKSRTFFNGYNPKFLNNNISKKWTIFKSTINDEQSKQFKALKKMEDDTNVKIKRIELLNESINKRNYWIAPNPNYDYSRKKAYVYDTRTKTYIRMTHKPSTKDIQKYEELAKKLNEERLMINTLDKPYGMLSDDDKKFIEDNVKDGKMEELLSSFDTDLDPEFWEYYDYTKTISGYKGNVKVSEDEWKIINGKLANTINNIESNLVNYGTFKRDAQYEIKLKQELNEALQHKLNTETKDLKAINGLTIRELDYYAILLNDYKKIKDNRNKNPRDDIKFKIIIMEWDNIVSVEDRLKMVNDRRKSIPFSYNELSKNDKDLENMKKLVKSTTIRDMTDLQLKQTLIQIKEFQEIYYKYAKLDKKIKDSIINNDILKSIIDLSRAISQLNAMVEPIKKEILSRSITAKNRKLKKEEDENDDSRGFFLKIWQDLDSYTESGFGIAGASFNIYTNGQYDFIAKILLKALPFIPLGNRKLNYNTIKKEKVYVDDMINQFMNINVELQIQERQYKSLLDDRESLYKQLERLKPSKGQGSSKEYRLLSRKFLALTGMAFRQFRASLKGQKGAFGNKKGFDTESPMNIKALEISSLKDRIKAMKIRFRAGMKSPIQSQSFFTGGQAQLVDQINKLTKTITDIKGQGRTANSIRLRKELQILEEELVRRASTSQNKVKDIIDSIGSSFNIGMPGENLEYGEFIQNTEIETMATQFFNRNILINSVSWGYNKASLVSTGYISGTYAYRLGKIGLKNVNNMVGKVPLILFGQPVIPNVSLPVVNLAPPYMDPDYKPPNIIFPSFVEESPATGLDKPDYKPDNKPDNINIPLVEESPATGLDKPDYKPPNINIPYVKDSPAPGLDKPDYKPPNINIPYVVTNTEGIFQRTGGSEDSPAPGLNIPKKSNSDYKPPDIKDSPAPGLNIPKKWAVIRPILDFKPKTVYMTKKLEQQAPNYIKEKEGFKQIKNGLMTDYEWYMTEDQIDRLKDKDILIKKKVERIRRKEREVIVNRQVGKPCGESKCKKYKDFVKVNGMFG